MFDCFSHPQRKQMFCYYDAIVLYVLWQDAISTDRILRYSNRMPTRSRRITTLKKVINPSLDLINFPCGLLCGKFGFISNKRFHLIGCSMPCLLFFCLHLYKWGILITFWRCKHVTIHSAVVCSARADVAAPGGGCRLHFVAADGCCCCKRMKSLPTVFLPPDPWRKCKWWPTEEFRFAIAVSRRRMSALCVSGGQRLRWGWTFDAFLARWQLSAVPPSLFSYVFCVDVTVVGLLPTTMRLTLMLKSDSTYFLRYRHFKNVITKNDWIASHRD